MTVNQIQSTFYIIKKLTFNFHKSDKILAILSAFIKSFVVQGKCFVCHFEVDAVRSHQSYYVNNILMDQNVAKPLKAKQNSLHNLYRLMMD